MKSVQLTVFFKTLAICSCEKHAVNLSHWTNINPESGVSSGATSETVHLTTDAEVEIHSSDTKIKRININTSLCVLISI